MAPNPPYTCSDYRTEMILLGLKKRLSQAELPPDERRALLDEIRLLEADLQMD